MENWPTEGSNFEGMIKISSNKPHGFGRFIIKDNVNFCDGQFKDGVWHGYFRVISKFGSTIN